MPARLKIEAGVRYGKFLVSIEEVRIRGDGQKWRFRCDCGNETVRRASKVISGEAISCGCRCSHPRHGHARRGTARYSPEYLSWMGMKARCNNPKQRNWRWYGGRGITVCERWANSFEAFLSDMGLKPSSRHFITRIDNGAAG